MPVHVVIGKPVALPKQADPCDADVEKHLQRFIDAMQTMIDKHKSSAGHERTEFNII